MLLGNSNLGYCFSEPFYSSTGVGFDGEIFHVDGESGGDEDTEKAKKECSGSSLELE